MTNGRGMGSSKHEKSVLRSGHHELPHIEEETFRPDRANNQTRVTHNTKSADTSSIGSNDSTKMIIKKEMQWQVDSEGGRTISQLDNYDIATEERLRR